MPPCFPPFLSVKQTARKTGPLPAPALDSQAQMLHLAIVPSSLGRAISTSCLIIMKPCQLAHFHSKPVLPFQTGCCPELMPKILNSGTCVWPGIDEKQVNRPSKAEPEKQRFRDRITPSLHQLKSKCNCFVPITASRVHFCLRETKKMRQRLTQHPISLVTLPRSVTWGLWIYAGIEVLNCSDREGEGTAHAGRDPTRLQEICRTLIPVHRDKHGETLSVSKKEISHSDIEDQMQWERRRGPKGRERGTGELRATTKKN